MLLEDPTPREEKITNADEQDVAVNHSVIEEGGYDEPVIEHLSPEQEESQQKEKKGDTEDLPDTTIRKSNVHSY